MLRFASTKNAKHWQCVNCNVLHFFAWHSAETEGFEPSKQFPVYTLSKRAPSATRTSLRSKPPFRLAGPRKYEKRQDGRREIGVCFKPQHIDSQPSTLYALRSALRWYRKVIADIATPNPTPTIINTWAMPLSAPKDSLSRIVEITKLEFRIMIGKSSV